MSGTERQLSTGSFENEAEARAVIELVLQLQRLSQQFPGKWYSIDRLRIITFYQGQVALLKRYLMQQRLNDVVVATVDSSQGCEADIVILSFVRSNGKSEQTSVGFLSDDRWLNVALTRGKELH